MSVCTVLCVYTAFSVEAIAATVKMYDLFSSEFGYRMRATVSVVRFLTKKFFTIIVFGAEQEGES